MMRRAAAFCSVLMMASLLRPTQADACGLKLAAKTPTPRQVARTISGSVLLLVNDRELESKLVSAGHTVETAPNATSAKRKSYNVIVADQSTVVTAREIFGEDAVVLRSGNVGSDSQQVASRAYRRPVRATDRAIIAARGRDNLVAAGPNPTTTPKNIVSAKPAESEAIAAKPVVPPPVTPPNTKPPGETPPVTPPPVTPPPERIAVKPPAVETPTTKPVAAPRVQAFARNEVYFGMSSATVTAGMQKQLDRTARWLQANADARVVVEGHADPSGNPDANMALSRVRAEAVRDYLSSVGVDASRVDVEAFGDTKLKYGARDGRNRRVFVDKK